MMRETKKSQQEMAGFVLIVVIVMIAGLVLFIISVKKDKTETQSTDLDNFLSSIMSYTTDCVPTITPNYYNVGKLISGCYESETCKNLNKDMCDYLNETLNKILDDFVKTGADILAYQFDVSYNSSGLKPLILPLKYGLCENAKVLGAEQKIRVDDMDINIVFRICKEIKKS